MVRKNPAFYGKYVIATTLSGSSRKGDEKMHQEMPGRRLRREHPEILTSMNNLANMLKSQGKYEEAEQSHCEPGGPGAEGRRVARERSC